MLAATLELDPAADEKVPHGARYKDFASIGQRRNASRNVNCDPANIGPAQVHLTRTFMSLKGVSRGHRGEPFVSRILSPFLRSSARGR